jgi:hypothetical protein
VANGDVATCETVVGKKQGVTCGDDGRVFAVASESGAKEDGACGWDVLYAKM